MSATRKTLAEFFERVFENMNIMARNVETLNRIRLELAELEAKAQELDRREKGVKVEYSHYEVLAYGTKDFYTCSECKQDVVIDGLDYCSSCGYRIDWKGENDNEQT